MPEIEDISQTQGHDPHGQLSDIGWSRLRADFLEKVAPRLGPVAMEYFYRVFQQAEAEASGTSANEQRARADATLELFRSIRPPTTLRFP